ncbi:heparinase II/III family protein [Candidatus Latescibacterota bacterium]
MNASKPFLYSILSGFCITLLLSSCDSALSHKDRLTIPTGIGSKPVMIDGNTEKLLWETDGTLVWEAPVGDRVLVGFPLPGESRFEDYDLCKFDLKIDGGVVDVMAFIERPGEKRRIYRPIDITVPRAVWQTIHLDLSQPEIVRETHFEADRPRITFNLWSVKTGYPDEGSMRQISIKNVRLTKRYLDVSWNGADYKTIPDDSGDLVYEYPIVVRNLDVKPRSVSARLEHFEGRLASARITPQETFLVPGDSTTFKAVLRIPVQHLKDVPVLYCEWFLPVFSVNGVPDSDEGILRSSDRITLPILKMPDKLENPIVLFDSDGLKEMRERYQTTDWGKSEGDLYIQQAEDILKGDLAIPDGPGWAAAYYYCHEHRYPLEYQGQGRHYCPVGGEYRDVDFMDIDLDRDYRTNQHTWSMRAARTLALAFALTKDTRFSKSALSILNQYRDRYFTFDWMDLDTSRETIDKGRIQFAKYMEAIYMLDLTEAFDILKGTGGISDEEARDIEENLLIPASVEMTDYRMGMIHRQSCITKNALATGLACRHAPLIAFATSSHASVLKLRRCAATAEGIAHGHGYANLTRRQLDMAGMLYRIGVDSYDHMLKRLLWGSLWWNVPFDPTRYASEFLSASKHYPDPVFRTYAARNLIEGEAPPVEGADMDISLPPSVNFPNSGLSILRRPWEDGALEAEFKWSMPDNRGSFSVLSLGLYFGGHRCQSYPGHFHWGSTDLHHNWQIQSASHSTIVVDRRNHSGMKDYFKDHYMPHDSRQVFFEDGKNAAASVAFNDRIYPGVKIWRGVCVLDGAFLVIDMLRSEDEHVYDRWFHGVPDHSNGLEGIDLTLSRRNDTPGHEDGYQMLHNLSSGVTNENLHCDWMIPSRKDRKTLNLAMHVLNTTSLEVMHGFEWSYQYRTPEKEFLLLTRKAQNAEFIVLFEPYRGQSKLSKYEQVTVTDESGYPLDETVGLKVTLSGKTYEIIMNPAGDTIRTASGITRKIFSVELIS